ncbi:MAG TPA: hypothetical protein VMU50_01725 [Polyangia bacterium]|nr:hypothetical protein [Polyangia bacterium]
MSQLRRSLLALALAPALILACQAGDAGNHGGNGTGSGGSSGQPNGSGGATGGGTGGVTMGNGSGGAKDAGADVPQVMGGGSGGHSGSGGASGSGGVTGGGGGGATGNARCNAAGLKWRSGSKTSFESYPTNPQECVDFNGCAYEGLFAACGDNKKSMAWVMSHNIVAAYPLGNLALHDLCLQANGKTIVVTVLDTCADSDCNGCCTENRGNADALIDVESFTDMRFGIDDGPIQWADLGPTTGGGCN